MNNRKQLRKENNVFMGGVKPLWSRNFFTEAKKTMEACFAEISKYNSISPGSKIPGLSHLDRTGRIGSI
jgi:hypothetical protein